MIISAAESTFGHRPIASNDAHGRSQRIGNRYELLSQLDGGSMSAVFRAHDHLRGEVVILKRLKGAGGGRAAAIDSAGRSRLAQEFRLLVALRHPNVVRVQDFGFDADGDPYFTMELQENAQTILMAACGRSLAAQVELLVQALRALVYVHRHRILHRDLKPENILVVGTQVKLLDFGLSTYADLLGQPTGGTLVYLAPEIIHGQRASDRSDLYSLGLVAYQMFVGALPFDIDDGPALRRAILEVELPRPADEIDSRLRPILAQLLAKNPEHRYGDAIAVIDALAHALDLDLSSETAATRESLLQAAPFVGRRDELATLAAALHATARGRGGTWLIGGESGVGKSRLIEEVRTRAQFDGMTTLEGQAISQGGGPYHAWREVLRHLLLHSPPESAEAAILATILPHVSDDRDSELTQLPTVDADARQSRLLAVVEALFQRAEVPIVVFLEDLQWAGSESLRMLAWLTRASEELPLMLVGTFRIDEAPQLAQEISGARQISLSRLAPDDVRRLCESVVDTRQDMRHLIDLVQRESEGLPFFIVEVLRALADASGGIEQIPVDHLPSHVSAGSVERVVRRRLDKVPGPALAPLRVAAVIGRTVDPLLLRVLFPDLDVEGWINECIAVAVLTGVGAESRFAHDKFREQLLADQPAQQRPALHRRVAEAIETTYSDAREHLTALAHLWREAGDTAKEVFYAERAGRVALENNACHEAIEHLRRSLELLAALHPGAVLPRPRRRRTLDPNAGIDPQHENFRLAALEAALTDAFFRLGHMADARQHGERALELVGQPAPRSDHGWIVATTGEGLRRVLQSLRRPRARGSERRREVAMTLGIVENRLIECFFYALKPTAVAWSILRVINRCEGIGPSSWLAYGYLHLSLTGELARLSRIARRWRRHAVEIAEQTGDPSTVGFTWSRMSAIDLGICDWKDSEQSLYRALSLAEGVGDVRLTEECNAQLGGHYFFTAQYNRTIAAMKEAARLCSRTGNRQVLGWALLGWGDALVRLGRADEALPKYEDVIRTVDQRHTIADVIWAFGMHGLAHLRLGNTAKALESAKLALDNLLVTKPVGYWVQHGSAATCEVFLTLLESAWTPPAGGRTALLRSTQQAIRCMNQYARRFPLGQGHAPIWEGLYSWVRGNPRRAVQCWHRAIRNADRLALPYECARAHFELGRHLASGDPQRLRHLEEARQIFADIECSVELGWAIAAIDTTT